MKFKIIFISFNILIIFSFLMVFLLPFFMLGGDYAVDFLKNSWYIAAIFGAILVFINILYFRNRRVLSYLEEENWAELKKHIEFSIFSRNRTGRMNVRMYVSTCIAVSAIDDLKLLEEKFRKEKPAAMEQWALQLGLPYLLKNDPVEMKRYFGEFLNIGTNDAGWIKWNYCFALLLMKETEEAVGILKLLCGLKKDPVLRLSSLYMLSPFGGDEAAGRILDEGRSELRSKLTRDMFAAEIEKRKDNVQMLFLMKIFGEAVDWLFQD